MKPVLVLRHTPHCPLGSAADVLADAGLACQHIDLFQQVPKNLPLDDAAGLIVLGGPMSANDVAHYPFLAPELEWLRQTAETEVPTLGICLGAQLLAKALGEMVYPNPVKEVGWYHIEPLAAAAEDFLFAGCRPRETVFHWHGETFDLPRGAIHLVQSQLCANQAFRYGSCAWGLQFHVEMTPEIMAEWFREEELSSDLDNLTYIDPDVIRSIAPLRFPEMNTLSRRLLSRFARLCRERNTILDTRS
jgi:GMP synthase-like glutamine amidotransferase